MIRIQCNINGLISEKCSGPRLQNMWSNSIDLVTFCWLWWDNFLFLARTSYSRHSTLEGYGQSNLPRALNEACSTAEMEKQLRTYDNKSLCTFPPRTTTTTNQSEHSYNCDIDIITTKILFSSILETYPIPSDMPYVKPTSQIVEPTLLPNPLGIYSQFCYNYPVTLVIGKVKAGLDTVRDLSGQDVLCITRSRWGHRIRTNVMIYHTTTKC